MNSLTFVKTLFYSQLFVTPPKPKGDFSGQTVVVTGANTGLGLEAVKHFIRLDASKVILAVRSAQKGDAAVSQVVEATQCDPSRLEAWQLDLSSFDSVKKFAIPRTQLDRLDAVVQNAGILTSEWTVTEGYETQITVDVISPLLLVFLLLPKLRESAQKTGLQGRISFVGSDLMYVSGLDEIEKPGNIFKNLSNKEETKIGDHYGMAKQLLHYGVRILAQMSPVTPESNVVINNHTPGACKSDIFRDDAGFALKVMMSIMVALVARTTEVGARTLVHAVEPQVGIESHEKFLMDCKIAM
ncbi:NAD(P)-binding protein [Aulographum hederae CBS 113979]|uniref:NAD(P)-binding protein n=1 Tax=Aulographum hederae CBS 113979 TaxID=1176131 RepID=A0A6G1HH01_9PEZI|nr:NAD(P)-binding protein [Aulographum hederae CBS 113979]